MKEKILPLPMTLEETRAYQWALSQQFGSVSATYARTLAEYIEKVSRVQPELFAEIEQLKAQNAERLEALEAIQEAFTKGEIAFTRKRQSDSDPYHPANVKMAAAIAKGSPEQRRRAGGEEAE